MPDGDQFLLDHIDKIAVPRKAINEPANEYWQLRRLWVGLEYLYSCVGPFDPEIELQLTRI